MDKIKLYPFGLEHSKKMYMVDSNILIEMSKFYYYGKCSYDVLTEELRKFLIMCKRTGLLDYSNAITEVCYDYGINQLNSDVLENFMIAIDDLIERFSIQQLENHSGAIKTYSKKRNSTCNMTSVFQCALPKLLFENELHFIDVFYIEYLYFLKIHYLYRKNINPIEKIKILFDFMVNKVDCVLAYELTLAEMLFAGNQDDIDTAVGILKINKMPTLKLLLNSTIDIMAFRYTSIVADVTMHERNPYQCIFVTCDKSLQNYIELNKKNASVISPNMQTDLIYSSLSVNPLYERDFDDMQENYILPILHKRYLHQHIHAQDKKDMSCIFDQIKELEAEVFCP